MSTDSVCQPAVSTVSQFLTSYNVKHETRDHLTWSSLPQTQAAPSGAPGILGTSFLDGKRVQFGSQGILSGSCVLDKALGSDEVRADAIWETRGATLDARLFLPLLEEDMLGGMAVSMLCSYHGVQFRGRN